MDPQHWMLMGERHDVRVYVYNTHRHVLRGVGLLPAGYTLHPEGPEGLFAAVRCRSLLSACVMWCGVVCWCVLVCAVLSLCMASAVTAAAWCTYLQALAVNSCCCLVVKGSSNSCT